MKKLSFADAPSVIFRFESLYFDKIKDLNVDGWNIWQVCKTGIFYKLIRAEITVSEINTKKSKKNIKSLFFSLIKFIKYRKSKWGTLFITYSADKLSKDKEGLFYNSIIYPIFDLNIFNEKIVIETPSADGFHIPSKYDWQIDSGLMNLFAILSYKLTSKKKDNSEQIIILASHLNNFLSNEGFDNHISEAYIDNIVQSFLIEKNYFIKILTKSTPRMIISSECMGRGVMAAATELKIPFIEMQHGGLDAYYPPYVWDARFLNLKKILKPTKILVFGSFAKNIILKSGFFNASEVAAVGYDKIEKIRKEYDSINPSILLNRILVVVQPMMHHFNVSLIEKLLKLNIEGFEILFKVHPLQEKHEIDIYNNMMYGSHIKIVGKNENIHQLIMNSDLVIGHISTCLEEALSLGRPSITITTDQLPLGIHSQTGAEELLDVIKPCSLSEVGKLISDYYKNEKLRNAWNNAILQKKELIYSSNYEQNIREVFKDI